MPKESLSNQKMQTTSLHLPADLIYLLRIIAVRRATRSGGRPSVSDVVREILEDNRDQLEVEASPPPEGPPDSAVSETEGPGRKSTGYLRVTTPEQSSVKRAEQAMKQIRKRMERE